MHCRLLHSEHGSQIVSQQLLPRLTKYKSCATKHEKHEWLASHLRERNTPCSHEFVLVSALSTCEKVCRKREEEEHVSESLGGKQSCHTNSLHVTKASLVAAPGMAEHQHRSPSVFYNEQQGTRPALQVLKGSQVQPVTHLAHDRQLAPLDGVAECSELALPQMGPWGALRNVLPQRIVNMMPCPSHFHFMHGWCARHTRVRSGDVERS